MLAAQESETRLVSSAVACRFPGWLGAVVSGGGGGTPPKVTRTVAPVGATASVVIETPVSGSVSVLPTASGASAKLVVAGVASTSCDCERVV